MDKGQKFDPSPHQNPLTDLHQNWHAWLCTHTGWLKKSKPLSKIIVKSY